MPLSPAVMHEVLRMGVVWACALSLLAAGRFLPF